MTARFLVGDVRARMTELDDHSIDFIACSPPFLALRSYLPDGHPDKQLEIGSEQTPADYLDVLLALTAEWRRLLAPHGSIAIELGDTYAGSGGAGGDYGEGGWRGEQEKFAGSALMHRKGKVLRDDGNRLQQGPGWPLDKSLTGIPTLYTWSLAYGRNLLTGQPSPAGRWRIRNLRPWIRSNPPVGALGDKVRPGTSYITVACVSGDRWHDLDAVRSPTITNLPPARGNNTKGSDERSFRFAERVNDNGGAPPLDWLVDTDTILDHELNERAGKPVSAPRTAKGAGPRANNGKAAAEGRGGQWSTLAIADTENGSVGARGVHLRRALQRAGILPTGPEADYYDISPRGYSGAHYAVWPPELVKLLIAEMCPRRVCVTCGEPSRQLVEVDSHGEWMRLDLDSNINHGGSGAHGNRSAKRKVLGWSDCGHNAWRPGRVLDPFVGSGTTLAVASGMGRDSIGIDLDERNADLARERVGMFLEVDYPQREATA